MSDNKVVGKKMLSFRSQTNKTNVDLSAMVFGKVQPQAIELEQAVLGALMLEKTAIAHNFARCSGVIRRLNLMSSPIGSLNTSAGMPRARSVFSIVSITSA